MAVYVSTGAFRTRVLPDILAEAEAMGLGHLELSSGCAPVADFDAMVPRLEASPLRLSVHNYFPPPPVPFVLNLGAVDAEALALSRDHVRRAIRLSARLGAPAYSVHSAFVLNLTPEALGRPAEQAALAEAGLPDRALVRRLFVNSLRLLAAEAAGYGIALLVENNVLAPAYFARQGINPFLMVTADEILSVLAEVAAPNLGLLLDVAHARVSATALGFDPVEFVARVAPVTRALHLSDNDGTEDSNLPFDGSAWFWQHLAPLSGCDAVVEVYRLERDDILSQVALVRRILGQE